MTSGLERLSLNQRTVQRWGVAETVAGCARVGIPAVGLWREQVAEAGLDRTVKLVRTAGLRVSSLCRGGFLTDPDKRAHAMADNRRAIDEAAALGAPTLVLVVGGLPPGSRDLVAARRQVADVLGELAPYAGQAGVRLGLEALHPMYCADRAVLSTLAQARTLAEEFPVEQVGVVIDTFHVWWDPLVTDEIRRAGQRITSYQLADWCDPLPADVLLGRCLPGDGPIDFAPMNAAVADAGYSGDIEVEVFNQQVWDRDPDEVIETIVSHYRAMAVPAAV